jgi:arsenical pump membrane protein
VSILLDSLQQIWPPFVLVAGLLLIGRAAADDGVFESVGARIAGAPFGSRTLLVALLGFVALVTALLNLDTAVVFLTPVLVHAARRRRLDERPFLYGTVFTSNSASLLLPGSNLTNMLVMGDGRLHQPGFALLLPSWLAACAITIAFVALVFPLRGSHPARETAPAMRVGASAIATVAAGALVVALANPALPVLVIGLGVTVCHGRRPRLRWWAPAFLFWLALGLALLGRSWDGPSSLLAGLGPWSTALVGAGASVALNNLPAAALLSARPAVHAPALLVGLDLGPNLAVTGSLSAWLWLDAARATGARASVRVYSLAGVPLAGLTLAGALAVLALRT